MPKGPTETQMLFPSEARRPLVGNTQQRLKKPRIPAPLNLTPEFHPPTPSQSTNYRAQLRNHDRKHPAELSPPPPLPPLLPSQLQSQPRRQKQPEPTSEMRVPPSPTPSSTSSLSLYSPDGSKKMLPVEVQSHEEEASSSSFCACLPFKSWFGGSAKAKAAKQARILGPPVPAPQMVQTRRRPPPITVPVPE